MGRGYRGRRRGLISSMCSLFVNKHHYEEGKYKARDEDEYKVKRLVTMRFHLSDVCYS